MTTALHKNLEVGEIHIPYNRVYNTAAEREAAVGFLVADVGSLARQLEDESLWMLVEHDPPSWVAVGSSGGGGLTVLAHRNLYQLIHFIDGGPAEGFLTGAYRAVTGTAFPTAITWYDSDSPAKQKIVEKLITWSGAFPTVITWNMYDSSEVLVSTVVDTISYSGAFETSRTRSIS